MGALVQSENLVESETLFEFENKQFNSLNYFHLSSVPFFFLPLINTTRALHHSIKRGAYIQIIAFSLPKFSSLVPVRFARTMSSLLAKVNYAGLQV